MTNHSEIVQVFDFFCRHIKITQLIVFAIVVGEMGGFPSLQAQPVCSETSVYTNPVIGLPTSVADPFVMKWKGEYYLYATGDPIMAYHSIDLVNWEEIGPVLYGSDEEDDWNQTSVWAPEVVYRNGKFYMNYTATRESSDWRIVEHSRRIGIAVSDSPEGPFKDIGHPVTPGWGIDSHVFLDPDDGKEYMFYSYLYEPRHPGAGLVVDFMPSVKELAGRPSHVTRGTEAWEDKKGNPNNGSLRYTNEGPTVIKRNNRYYMMYSGGSWDLPTYSLAYAVSDRIMEGGLDGPGWEKMMPPLLQSTTMVEAPGHNSVTKAPNNVDDITAYHARVVPFRSPGDRETFIDRIFWIHDRMHLQQPTLGALTAPDRPVFRDIFRRENGNIGNKWIIKAGSWKVINQHARGKGFVIPDTQPYTHYVFEANIRFSEGRTFPGGVTAYYGNEENHINVWLDPAKHVLRTTGKINGEALSKKETKLSNNFRFDVYHQIIITKNANHLRITLDGVNLQEHRLEMHKGRVGLITKSGTVDYDGIALTPYYLDHFNNPEVTWETIGGAWLIDEGSFHQVAGADELYYAIKGDAAESYEFTASVKPRDYESTSSTTGVIAATDGKGRKVLAGFDHGIWPYASFWVRLIDNLKVEQELNVGLPRGFIYDEYHTIRVIKQGENFTFYLDEAKMAAVRFPFGLAKPGLYTKGVRAAFDDVSMKHTVVPHNLILNGSFLAKSWSEEKFAPEMPWQLSGSAEFNMCCGHTGNDRLLITGSDGLAVQKVDQLEPGQYKLYAWITTIDAEGEVHVEVEGGKTYTASKASEAWQKVIIAFDISKQNSTVNIYAQGSFQNEGDGLVAMDDFYLVKMEKNTD